MKFEIPKFHIFRWGFFTCITFHWINFKVYNNVCDNFLSYINKPDMIIQGEKYYLQTNDIFCWDKNEEATTTIKQFNIRKHGKGTESKRLMTQRRVILYSENSSHNHVNTPMQYTAIILAVKS